MADPPVVEVMAGFRRELLAREAAQMAEMARRWLQVERALMGEMEALAARLDALRRAGQAPTQGQILQMGRYQALVAQLRQEWALYQQYAVETISAGQQAFGAAAIQGSVAALEATAPGISVTFTRLPLEAVEAMVGLVGDGSPLAAYLARAATEAAMVDDLTAALVRGTALGWNPRETARKMADGMSGGLNQALRTARTEQLRVFREIARQSYAASGVVSGYKRLAARDSRTCAACLAADGTLYRLDEVMPEHPSGRCTMVPVVVGYGSPQWEQGPQWFAGQSSAVQRQILGQGRFDAWQAGAFLFEDLATVQRDDVWGDSLQAAPLKSLIGG